MSEETAGTTTGSNDRDNWKDEFPIFDAYHVVDEEDRPFTAVHCELCGQIHLHGPERDRDVGEISHRSAHCGRQERKEYVPDVSGYYLRISDSRVYPVRHGKHHTGPIIIDQPIREVADI